MMQHRQKSEFPLKFQNGPLDINFSPEREMSLGICCSLFWLLDCLGFFAWNGHWAGQTNPTSWNHFHLLKGRIQNGQQVKVVQCLSICYTSDFARHLAGYSSIQGPQFSTAADLTWNIFLQFLSQAIKTTDLIIIFKNSVWE